MKKTKKQNTVYISDDFQIGYHGTFEYTEDDIKFMLDQIDDPSEVSPELRKALREYKKQLKKKEKKSKRKN